MKKNISIATFLNRQLAIYQQPGFIAADPVSIPHRFTLQQDIEIAGFFAALLAWGNRTGIIRSCNRLMQCMDDTPYHYIMQLHNPDDQACYNRFAGFVHRTCNQQDIWHLLNFLHHHYKIQAAPSLETAFSQWMKPKDATVENALIGFHQYVFSFDEAATEEIHCRKHIATPLRKSACKRLNMYLRWMVRSSANGVDFGIWKKIKPAQLMMPLDVHVSRVARQLGLLQRKQDDWQAALELTEAVRSFDPKDPVKYDFVLFGLGVSGKQDWLH